MSVFRDDRMTDDIRLFHCTRRFRNNAVRSGSTISLQSSGTISNAVYEASGAGGFLGKPYEPNSVIKNDIEFILMLRKPGGYRKPDAATKLLSVIGAENYQLWFQQIWTGLTGESTKHHPAPYPVQLAERLIRMFSFVGDVVLDPFLGTGTTAVAAARSGRNSLGYEIQETYLKSAVSRVRRETLTLFRRPEVVEVWGR